MKLIATLGFASIVAVGVWWLWLDAAKPERRTVATTVVPAAPTLDRPPGQTSALAVSAPAPTPADQRALPDAFTPALTAPRELSVGATVAIGLVGLSKSLAEGRAMTAHLRFDSKLLRLREPDEPAHASATIKHEYFDVSPINNDTVLVISKVMPGTSVPSEIEVAQFDAIAPGTARVALLELRITDEQGNSRPPGFAIPPVDLTIR